MLDYVIFERKLGKITVPPPRGEIPWRTALGGTRYIKRTFVRSKTHIAEASQAINLVDADSSQVAAIAGARK